MNEGLFHKDKRIGRRKNFGRATAALAPYKSNIPLVAGIGVRLFIPSPRRRRDTKAIANKQSSACEPVPIVGSFSLQSFTQKVRAACVFAPANDNQLLALAQLRLYRQISGFVP